MKKHLNKERGFTLIELLVVISIIGLLSSVVLASVNVAREKGRIAAIQTFATHNYHKVGADILGSWRFDETVTGVLANNTTIADFSGSGNDGVVVSGAGSVTSETNTYNNSGKSVKFTSGSRININMISSDIKNISSKGTISFWFNTTNTTATLYPVAFFDLFTIGMNTVNNSVLAYSYPLLCGNNRLDGTITSNKSFSDGKWHNLTVTFDTGKNAVAYFDGSSIGTFTTNTYANHGISYSTCPKVLSINSAGNTLVGNMDEVFVYGEYLLASDVQKLYAQGLPPHQLAENR